MFVFPEIFNRAGGEMLRPQVKLFAPQGDMPANKRNKTSTRFTVKLAADVQKVKENYDLFHAVRLPGEVGPDEDSDTE